VDAYHRLIVLLNFIDGLGVDFQSENRRFVLYQPTSALVDLPSETKATFTEKFNARFTHPGDSECINALYTYLTNVKIKYRNPAAWNQARSEVMKNSKLKLEVREPQPHIEFMHTLTDPRDYYNHMTSLIDDGPEVSCTYVDPSRSLGYPARHFGGSAYMLVMSKAALYALYCKYSNAVNLLTQNMFSRHVGCILRGSMRYHEIPYAGVGYYMPPLFEKKMDNGTRFWRFNTMAVYLFLTDNYHFSSPNNDENEIVTDIRYGSMFY